VDGAVDGGSTPQTGCFQRWFDGAPSLALSPPTQLTALAGTGDDRDPWISADGLRLYFSRNPGQQGGRDIYLATRASTRVDFTTVSAVVNLDTPDDESRAALSGDEKLVVFSGDHTSNGNFQLFASRRGDPTRSFPSPSNPDQALVASINTSGDDYFDPFLSTDGLRLYVAPLLTGSPQQIRLATRTALDKNFGAAAPVAVINSGSADADPALSPDERVIVFSSTRPAATGSFYLYYATRDSATGTFAAPIRLDTLSSSANDSDPALTADGCHLFFASDRQANDYDIFSADVAP
jgi:Tol biopolymer transport system component